MRRHRNFLPFIALAAAVATPALGQTGTSGGEPRSGETKDAASIPDFSRVWNHPASCAGTNPSKADLELHGTRTASLVCWLRNCRS
jgi:hypothetical protein